MIIFWGFQDFLIYLAKYFWSTWNSPNVVLNLFQLICRGNINTTFLILCLKIFRILNTIAAPFLFSLRFTLTGILNPENQFFMQNTNSMSFWSTQTFLDLLLKGRNRLSVENRKNWAHWHFLLFLQTIQLSENIRAHATS